MPKISHAAYARTYSADMNLTLAINDEVIQRARRRAEVLGTSFNQLVREYLEQLAGKTDPNEAAAREKRVRAIRLFTDHRRRGLAVVSL